MYYLSVVVLYYSIWQLLNTHVSCDYNGFYNHLGTKTPYRVRANSDVSPITYDGCEPTKIWMVIRHGTRLPSYKFIHDVAHTLPAIRDRIVSNSATAKVHLSTEALEAIRQWTSSIREADEKRLTHEGENEMVQLAERMQLRFPTILSNIYSNTSYKFKYTATQRTQESAKYFATGLFGRHTARAVWYPEPLHKDPVLRFYKLCNRWRASVKKNPDAVQERVQYIQGPEMRAALREISVKLGFVQHALTFDEVHTMYMTCAFETAWSAVDKPSPWCKVFDNATIQALEYSEDLRYYWVDGYGYNLTHEQACPAVSNLVEFFSRAEEYPRAVLYFTHSGTILKLLAHLGLYRDAAVLRHDTQGTDSRRWRVSEIDAFASNIAAVLYSCGSVQRIEFLHQERRVAVSGCPADALCDFSTFLSAYRTRVQQCDFTQMCQHQHQQQQQQR